MSDSAATAKTPISSFTSLALGGGDAFAEELIHLPLVMRHGASLFLVAVTTGVALAVERLVAATNIALFFVIPVVLAATMFGWGPSLAAAVAGVLAFDFFFTEPKYSLVIASPSDVWAAGLLLLTAAIVSTVAAQSRRRAEEARQAAIRAEALRALAHMVVEARPRAEIIRSAAATLNQIFRAPAVVLVEQAGSLAAVAAVGNPMITKAEEDAARESFMSKLATRSQTYPFSDSKFDFWPVADWSGRHAVLGVDFTRADRGRPTAPERSVEVVAGYLAVAFRGEAGA